MRSVWPATKASAVIVISGAVVASLALPASALPASTLSIDVRAGEPALTSMVTVPSAVPAPLAPAAFGSIGFTGVVKPKPVPAPIVVPASPVRGPANGGVSRSTTRAPLADPAPRSGGVLGIAASLAGIYYVYGGTTPAGFDCSGFTQYVFGKVGISLPRTAEAQRQFVTTVSDPVPGDLVFFGAPAGHMGIYAGNGMMWDSPRTGKAVSLRSIYSGNVTYGRP